MRSRQRLVAIGLCALGSVLVLVAASRAWVTWSVADDLTVTALHDERSGASLYPELTACAVLGLAAVAAILATSGWSRRLLGLVLVAGGAAIAARAVSALQETSGLARDALADAGGCPASGCESDFLASVSTPVLGPVLAAVGGAVLLLSGLLTVARGHRWAGLSSSYEAPGAAPEPPVTDKAVWDSLDRGDDPTA